MKIAIFNHGIVILGPLAEERQPIYQRNLCIADSTGLSSFVLPLLPLKSAKSREITRKFKRIAVQGHPRSSGVPTVGVTRCGIAMVSPLYQLSPPLTKCKKLMLRKCVYFEQKSIQTKKSNLSEFSYRAFTVQRPVAGQAVQ